MNRYPEVLQKKLKKARSN